MIQLSLRGPREITAALSKQPADALVLSLLLLFISLSDRCDREITHLGIWEAAIKIYTGKTELLITLFCEICSKQLIMKNYFIESWRAIYSMHVCMCVCVHAHLHTRE